MEEAVIIVRKTKDNGGYRAAIYLSQGGAKLPKETFAKTIKEALIALAENFTK